MIKKELKIMANIKIDGIEYKAYLNNYCIAKNHSLQQLLSDIENMNWYSNYINYLQQTNIEQTHLLNKLKRRDYE